jgi:hypothetical protein
MVRLGYPGKWSGNKAGENRYVPGYLRRRSLTPQSPAQ